MDTHHAPAMRKTCLLLTISLCFAGVGQRRCDGQLRGRVASRFRCGGPAGPPLTLILAFVQVLISVALCTKAGRLIMSRQFVETTRIRRVLCSCQNSRHVSEPFGDASVSQSHREHHATIATSCRSLDACPSSRCCCLQMASLLRSLASLSPGFC